MPCRRANVVASLALVIALCALVLWYRFWVEAASQPEPRPERQPEPRQPEPPEPRLSEPPEPLERPACDGPRLPALSHGIPQYTQIGLLESAGSEKDAIPLFGRPTRRGSANWNYFSRSNTFSPQRLPIFVAGRDCARLQGTSELCDGDIVDVRGFGSARVALYTREDAETQFRLV
jgi:hypothetical protein